MQVDPEQTFVLLQKLARKECEQTRKNLDRELAEWKAKCAHLSQRLGRLRQANRQLREEKRAYHSIAKAEIERAAKHLPRGLSLQEVATEYGNKKDAAV